MPKFYRITKNIYVLTPSSNIYSSANVNFIKDKKITLIDSGTRSDPGPRNIRKILRSIGVNPPRIDLIIITHSHIDHFTGAQKLKKIFNFRLLAHTKADPSFKQYSERFQFWEFLENTYPRLWKSKFLRNFIYVFYNRFYGFSKGLELDQKLEEGDEINLGELNFRIIFTPGHSPDSICLYEPRKKIIFTGDMVPYTPYIHTTISDFRSSIKKLLKLDVKLAIRGHGRPVLWLEEKKRYINFLKDMDVARFRILKLLKLKGPQTAHQMANSVFKRTHLIHKTIYTNIMRVTVYWIFKYLEELKEEGKIKSEIEKDKIVFSIV